jgi:hypothetical protein
LRKEKDDMDAEEVCVSNLDGSMPWDLANLQVLQQDLHNTPKRLVHDSALRLSRSRSHSKGGDAT